MYTDLKSRHGWGCTADPEKAMIYLSAAASNAASVENTALKAGVKGGGAAKGELVLAIFELANSFRPALHLSIICGWKNLSSERFRTRGYWKHI